jgi:manganese transport system permease protein
VGMSALVLASIFILKKDLLLFCFDPGHARSLGLNTQVLHYVFLSLLALTIVLSLQAVGVILVIAMLITPGCVALLLTQRFHWMLFWAISSAVVSCFLGTYLSYFINGATGACIVLIQTLQFLGVIAFSPKFGWLRKKNLSVA